jgi:hypothetical protein
MPTYTKGVEPYEDLSITEIYHLEAILSVLYLCYVWE